MSSPLKTITIHNLDLKAATNGAKLARLVKGQQDIKIDSETLWTDSTTVLNWINFPNQRHQIIHAKRFNLKLCIQQS